MRAPAGWTIALLLTVTGPGPTRAEQAAPSQDAPGGLAEAAFDPAVVALPDEAPERAIRRALLEGDQEQARALAARALAEQPDAASLGRLRWLAARASDDAEARAKLLTALFESDHPLSPWAGLLLSQSLRDDDPARAAEIAAALPTDWAGAREARYARALALHEAQDADAAEPLLRALIEEAPENVGAATAAMPLAEILERRPGTKPRLEAASLYRRVSSRAPLAPVGERADAALAALLKKLPQRARRAFTSSGFEDAVYRGKALMNARRYEDAEAVFAGVVDAAGSDAERACQARLDQGRAIVYRRDRPRAAEHMARLAADCESPEIRAWARYYQGRALLRSGDPAGAVTAYRALRGEVQDHSLLDDSLFMEASALRDQGDSAGANAALETLLRDYPDGDMAAEARLSLAFDARRRGDHATALSLLEALQRDEGGYPPEGAEGRTGYWRARTLVALGRREQAVEAFAGVVDAWPLSYYAQQALARLAELKPALARDLVAALSGEPEPALRFARRPELSDPAFARALALLRVGEAARAQHELSALGMLSAGADPDALWLSAALLHHAGEHAEASTLARTRLKSYRGVVPRGRARALWRIAFPRAYAPLIEDVAKEAGVPAAFVRAVAREESAFNPEAVSSAKAYGLIQLIASTARSHAEALGLPSSPSALKRPEINLRIGSRFIRTLWKHYDDNPAVVPAAYNAGRGATDRWLSERGSLPLDEWVERIPYAETRRYTRRVLQSYGIYAFLDGGKLPPLRPELPNRAAK